MHVQYICALLMYINNGHSASSLTCVNFNEIIISDKMLKHHVLHGAHMAVPSLDADCFKK